MNLGGRVGLALVVLLSTSCTAPHSKYGGELTPTVLRAGAGSASDSPGGDVLAGWAVETEQSTAGAITLSVGHTPSPDAVDEDGSVLGQLRSGDLDVGILRAPSFSAAGVTAFQALQAPFLIDNEELARRISGDPIADEMLDELGAIGLVGLAIVPGGLRHPVGWHRPLLGLEDYRGAVINTRPSPDVDRLFAALGASTDHAVGQGRVTGAATGALRGVDMSLLIHTSGGAPASLTTNVVLYTKFDVVVMRREAFEGLSSTQRAALLDALDRAVTHVLGARPSESVAVRAWCELEGQATVAATTTEVAELHEAGQVVVDELRRDPLTARVLDRIDSLAAGTRPAELPICEGPLGPTPDAVPEGDQRVLDGTWRFETTREDLLDVGVPAGEVDKDVGVKTYVLSNGRLEGGMEGEFCTGSYVLSGRRLTWAFDPTSCGGAFRATYRLDGDHLELDIDPTALGGWFFRGYMKHGLVRIADAP